MRLRPVARTIVRRGFLTMIMLQVVTIGTLMIVTKVRKIIRGRAATPFPVTPPRPIPIGDQGTATAFTYGADLYEDMLAAIDAAQDRILFETYIIKGDAMGERFKQALIRAADRGVDVYVVYDAFANLVVRPSFLRFPRIGPRAALPDLLGRTGRSSASAATAATTARSWSSTRPSATSAGSTSAPCTRPSGATPTSRSSVPRCGTSTTPSSTSGTCATTSPPSRSSQLGEASWEPQVRAHRNVPRQLMFPIRGMYLEAIDRAKDHIYITAAYFIPDRDILQGLIEAADAASTCAS